MRAAGGPRASRPPNIVLIITDQQRAPRHWPEEPGWLEALMPNDAALARTGLTFANGFCNTAMCSPSRATLFTGRYPAEHGVDLTLTAGGTKPDPRNTPAVASTMAGILKRKEAPANRVLGGFARGALRLGPKAGGEPVLPTDMPNMATLLADAGYAIGYKGKWHLTHPQSGSELLGGWGAEDERILERDYGFAGWEAPDAGENTKAENFGGGNAADGRGWDQVYARESVEWLTREELPEPFCLIVSLINPHDVLGYPASHMRGGYAPDEFDDLGVEVPSTIDEDLSNKPSVHSLMRMGMAAYLGPLRDRCAQTDYVNFYAHLHRVVDRKIGQIVDALGDAGDPGSLRSRTMIVRCADHGEMGLSHGGLRQKMFNAYEETINVPILFSNPVLFPNGSRTGALASLVDLVPTFLSLAGAEGPADLRGEDLTPVLASAADPAREPLRRVEADLSGLADHPAPAPSVRDAVHFTFDDHQAGTMSQDAPGQPNRVRAVRTADGRKYAFYFDPKGQKATEYEMYDLSKDPLEVENMLEVRTGEPRGADAAALKADLADLLDEQMKRCATAGGDGPRT